MSAKHRLQIAGGIYHVTARGNAQAEIFLDEHDYLGFLRLLATQASRRGWLCHSFCLIPNHYHLLLETPEPNLAQGMRIVNGTFAQRFNARYHRYGHVFQGPYGAVLLGDDDHLLEVCRYIALNPVRAGLASTPAEWPWSSYAALAGLQEAPTFVHLGLAHSLLGGAAGYRDFVAAGDTRRRPGRDQVAVVSALPGGAPRPPR
ncbi:MAG TPA: transposase [Gaiellaceae bacterium]|nr:transposase [Gaiellaceae bacterium]